MTDSTGMFQHASFTAPNLSEGYCTASVKPTHLFMRAIQC
jgi:hypothetical protein